MYVSVLARACERACACACAYVFFPGVSESMTELMPPSRVWDILLPLA